MSQPNHPSIDSLLGEIHKLDPKSLNHNHDDLLNRILEEEDACVTLELKECTTNTNEITKIDPFDTFKGKTTSFHQKFRSA